MGENQFVQTDKQIERNRGFRALVALVSPVLAFNISYMLMTGLASWLEIFEIIGKLGGAGLGTYVAVWLVLRSFVVNKGFIAFVTVNPLATLFGLNPYVSYGPGLHLAYWWEQRSADNVVNLAEVTEKILVEIQGRGGAFHLEGSVRYRPDISLLQQHLTGAGVVAEDVTDLIVAKITEELSDKEIRAGLSHLPTLNESLDRQFRHGGTQATDVTQFEKRFGVIIGDVTIATIKPSKEVQKALDGAAESVALNIIVARNLGYETMEGVHQAVKEGTLTSSDVASATKVAMAMTDNLHGLNLSDQNFNLSVDFKNVDPAVAEALARIAPAVATAVATKRSEKTKGGK